MNTPDQREPPAIQRTTYDQWRCTLYAVQHPSGLRSQAARQVEYLPPMNGSFRPHLLTLFSFHDQ